MDLGAAPQHYPLARALLNRRGVAAEREDLRFVVVRIDHRDLVGLAQRLD
jgi:hypothetical protein